MQPEDDAALPRGFDSEDCEVYQKNSDSNSVADVNIDGSIGTSSSISNLFGGSSCIGNSGGAGVSNQIGNFFASSGTSNGPLGCTEAMDSLGNYVKKKFKQLIQSISIIPYHAPHHSFRNNVSCRKRYPDVLYIYCMQCGLYRFGCCSVSTNVGITSSIQFHWKVNENNICL